MKLINTRTGQPLATAEKDGSVLFHQQILAQAMEEFGVDIPAYLRAKFSDKTHVFTGDPGFERAFREVYYTLTMDRDLYKWVE